MSEEKHNQSVNCFFTFLIIMLLFLVCSACCCVGTFLAPMLPLLCPFAWL
ncbi:hypothetical protein JW978_00935 [Candidatus Dojkabacteria bacterium]|nr:hypothetical protein [Candidatus Dojkabacteria bacterium]